MNTNHNIYGHGRGAGDRRSTARRLVADLLVLTRLSGAGDADAAGRLIGCEHRWRPVMDAALEEVAKELRHATRLQGDDEIVAASPAASGEKVAAYLRELRALGGDKPAALAAWRASGMDARELLAAGGTIFSSLDFIPGYAGRQWAEICRKALAVLDARWPDERPDRLAELLGDAESVTYQEGGGSADVPWHDETRTRGDLTAACRATAEAAGTIVALSLAEHNTGRLLAKHDLFFKADARWLDAAAECHRRDLHADLLRWASPGVRGLWATGPLAGGEPPPHALDLAALAAAHEFVDRPQVEPTAHSGDGGTRLTVNLDGPPFLANAHDALRPRGGRGVGSDRAATLCRWLPAYDLAEGWSAALAGEARAALADLLDVRPDLSGRPFNPEDGDAIRRAADAMLRRRGGFAFETRGPTATLMEDMNSSLGDLMAGVGPEVLMDAVPPAAGRVAAGFMPAADETPHPAEIALRAMDHGPIALSVPDDINDAIGRDGFDMGLSMVGYRGYSVPAADLVAAVRAGGPSPAGHDLAGDADMLGLLATSLPPHARVAAFVFDAVIALVTLAPEEVSHE